MPDEKKYPWIKSIFGRKKKPNPAEGVYAGPGQMGGYKKPDIAKCVYAGPEIMKRKDPEVKIYDGPARPPREESDDVIDVYAGPEFFGEEEPFVDDQPTIYAGPGFPVGDADDEGLPEESAPETAEPEAPPFYPPVPPDMAMCVYAGPEQMAGNYQPIGVYISEEEWNKAANPDNNDKV